MAKWANLYESCRRQGNGMSASKLWNYRGAATGIRNFAALDGLRGYMAWWVVIGHAIQLCGLSAAFPRIAVQGYHGVSVFIILSGFVITHLLLEKKEAYGPYLTRRAFRIFPIYWFCLAFAILILPAYNEIYQGDWVQGLEMRLARQIATDENFATHVALHIPLLHGLVPDTILPFSSSALLAPAWSLTLEWQFYLVAPFIVGALIMPGWPRLIAALVMLALFVYFQRVIPLKWQYDAALPLAFQFFLIGILSRVFLPALSKVAVWIFVVGVALYFLTPHNFKFPALIWAFFLMATCLEVRVAQGKKVGIPALKRLVDFICSNVVARRVGETSYATYLVHIPVFVVAGYVASKILGEWTQAVCIASTAVATIFLIPIGFLLYNLIERRFIQLGAQVIKRRPIGSTAS